MECLKNHALVFVTLDYGEPSSLLKGIEKSLKGFYIWTIIPGKSLRIGIMNKIPIKKSKLACFLILFTCVTSSMFLL